MTTKITTIKMTPKDTKPLSALEKGMLSVEVSVVSIDS